MKIKNVTGAAVTDLGELHPFVAGSSVVVLNTGSSADTLQQSASASGPFATVPGAAAIAAGQGVEVVITERYVAIENGAGTLVLLQN
jgi:hypothetical protein